MQLQSIKAYGDGRSLAANRHRMKWKDLYSNRAVAGFNENRCAAIQSFSMECHTTEEDTLLELSAMKIHKDSEKK